VTIDDRIDNEASIELTYPQRIHGFDAAYNDVHLYLVESNAA